MSNEQEHTEEHGSLIKTPKQLIVTVVLAFLVPIIIIIMLVNMVAAGSKTGAGSNTLTPEAIDKRIAPVAQFELVDANAPKVFKTGEQVFQSTCSACHGTGVAGAPKFGDKDAWAKYIKQGYEDLVKNAIHGIGAMPPKGGNASLDDFEVARAVVYMTNQSGANFDEPKEPAAGDGEAKAEAAPAQAAAAPAAAAEQPAASEQAAPAAAQDAAPQQAAAPAEAASANPLGEKIYKTYCFACHASGVAGAPKFGDKEAWAPFIKTGMDEMLKNAIKGVGAMPPRGGSQATDEELKAAIEYMVDAAQ